MAEGTWSSPERALTRAKLINLKLPFQFVMFDFNPKEVTMNKVNDNAEQRTAAGSGTSGSIFRGTFRTTLTMSNIILEGNDAKPRAEQLLNWMQPGGGLVGQLVGGVVSAATGGRLNLATKLTVLTFQWGPPALGFMMDCTIQSCGVTFKRFDPTGFPNRAVVSLTLREEPSIAGLLPTNPTSGGLPGRESRVVTDGETLQSIATEAYGAPQYWRALAAANGIDDPMRVRPGRVVYLPSANELLARQEHRP